MGAGEILQILSAAAVVVSTVITGARLGSAKANSDLVATLRDRIDTLQAEVEDLKGTINRLRDELHAARQARPMKVGGKAIGKDYRE